MNEKQTRARYTAEFKQEAVRQVKEGRAASVVAKTLGMPKASLTNWVRDEAKGQLLKGADGKTAVTPAVTPEQAELARLRAEVARLRMERDIAKKALCAQPVVATGLSTIADGAARMAQMGRPGLSIAQKQELWRRWKEGQSLTEIGNALGKHAGSIHGVLSRSGGIAPPERRRSERSLSASEREAISRGLAAGDTIRAIARTLGRAPSTVSREIQRNRGSRRYRAVDADEAAWRRARRPKVCRLAEHSDLRELVANKLSLDWSPEQIAGWLRVEFANCPQMQISHEAIYRTLYVQARGVLKRELLDHLRSRRMMRRSRHASTEGQPRGRIPEAVSISERPPEAEDRAVPGHWEGDLISGSNNSHVVTLVERTSRFTVLVKIAGKDTESVVGAMSQQVQRLPAELRRSLTWDRGGEMAGHREFTVATDVQVYFCDPRSPWQRGTNENTNRLLRQYFPKGTDLSVHSQDELDRIARQLNERPRKTLGYRSPAFTLRAAVATTG